MKDYQRLVRQDGTVIRSGQLDTVAKFSALVAGLDLRDKDVLDVGCNSGMMSLLAAAAGAHVLGIDSDPEILAVARNFREYERPSSFVMFLRLSLATIPSTKKFDVVIASSVLHHCGDFDRSIRKLVTLLRPGGVLTADIWPATYRSPYDGSLYSVPSEADMFVTLFKHFSIVEDRGDASALGRPGTRWIRAR